jgi:hypothetical protein
MAAARCQPSIRKSTGCNRVPKSAANATSHLSSAVSEFAQNAKAAADLLLGALSPLNDEQKLQYAISGLRRGTVTQEQVLQIGRQLYASSQAYTDLFNMVRSIGDHTGTPGISHGGGSDSTQPFTAADAQRLDDLKARRDVLEDRERKQEANQLATIVAQLGFTQKESFQQVADELGFNLADLAKDLGLNTDQLNTYLTNIQKQQTAIPDAVTANTDRQIRAMYDIAGKPLPPWAIGTVDADGNVSIRGHSTHGRGASSATDTDDLTVRGHSSHGRSGADNDRSTVVVNNPDAFATAQATTNTKLDQILFAVREGTAATRGVETATRGVDRTLRTPGQPNRRNARAAQG